MGLSAGCGGCLVRLVRAGWFLVGWLWCGGRVLCAACVLRCVWLLWCAGCLLVACGCLLVRACVRVLVGAGGWWGCAVGFWGGASRWWLCRGWLVACCCLPSCGSCRLCGWWGPLGWVVGGWWLAGVGGLVVICIVDASIFVLCVFCWVVLVFWAFGGCLGIRGR